MSTRRPDPLRLPVKSKNLRRRQIQARECGDEKKSDRDGDRQPAKELAIGARDKIACRGGVIVIPSRYASTRFPGKALALIAGVSLIQRVYERAVQSRRASAVYVATDDDRIADHVRSFGGRVVQPPGEFQRAPTDRRGAFVPR